MTIAVVFRYADGRTGPREPFLRFEDATCYALGIADDLGNPETWEAAPRQVCVVDGDRTLLAITVLRGGLAG